MYFYIHSTEQRFQIVLGWHDIAGTILLSFHQESKDSGKPLNKVKHCVRLKNTVAKNTGASIKAIYQCCQPKMLKKYEPGS